MARAVIGGFIVVLAVTVAALLSSYSNGALIRALGGVSPVDSVARPQNTPGLPDRQGHRAVRP
ncbi:MAG TPA: hypothetical protein VGJ20_11155 [Xanthobacteraceae bacterium]|jgi:hypothetical protein